MIRSVAVLFLALQLFSYGMAVDASAQLPDDFLPQQEFFTQKNLAKNRCKNPVRAIAFLAALKKSVAGEDKKSVAELAAYPVSIGAFQKMERRIANRGEFIEQYDSIITDGIREAVLSGKAAMAYPGAIILMNEDDQSSMLLIEAGGGWRFKDLFQ